AEHSSGLHKVIVETEKYAKIGFANSRRVLQYGAKDGPELARRTIDDAQHLGSGRLLLQRFAQLVEQARVLDGDQRLIGKGGHELDLFPGKRLRHFFRYEDPPAHIPFVHQRGTDRRSIAADLLRSAPRIIRVR